MYFVLTPLCRCSSEGRWKRASLADFPRQPRLVKLYFLSISILMLLQANFKQPFPLSIASVICAVLSLGSEIVVLILQVVSNQLPLFSIPSSSYLQGLTDINTSSACGATALSMTLSHYCSRYQNHLVYLRFANALLMITIFILIISLAFLIVLTVIIKKKIHICGGQKKLKQTVLGLRSIGLVLSISVLGYYSSFYANFAELAGYSTSISRYRSSFFPGLIASCSGGVWMLLDYIILFLIKTEETNERNTYKAANST